MKGDRAAEDELNPSGNADLCWSGKRGRCKGPEERQGGAGGEEAGEGRGEGQGHCVCRRGCCGHPGLPRALP